MNIDFINKYLEENISEKRLVHTYAVRDVAMKLAENYGADKEKANVAALLHDMCKNLSIAKMNEYVEHFKLDFKYKDNLNLAHSKVAAKLIERDFGITDSEILNAVSYHTTGRANMSLLEKIIYLADAIEPNRNYAGIDELRKMAFVDLNKACMLSLSKTVEFVKSQNLFLDEDTIEAVNYLR